MLEGDAAESPASHFMFFVLRDEDVSANIHIVGSCVGSGCIRPPVSISVLIVHVAVVPAVIPRIYQREQILTTAGGAGGGVFSSDDYVKAGCLLLMTDCLLLYYHYIRHPPLLATP